jgi:DNA-binding MarR family transcriptional regulator
MARVDTLERPHTRPAVPKKEVPAESTRTRVRRLHQIFDAEWAKQVGDLNVSSSQYDILLAVQTHSPCSQTRLVEATGVDRSTLADVVRRLTKKGLLRRRRTKEDARAYAVALTPEGVNLLRKLAAVETKVGQRVLEAVDEDFFNTFRLVADTIIESHTKTAA